MWPHTPTDTRTQTQWFFSPNTKYQCLLSRAWSHNWCPQTNHAVDFLLGHKHWNVHQNCYNFWPCFLIRPYSRTTALHWGGIGTSMYCSVTGQPQGASPVHPITKAVTPRLISLMGDPWQAAPALTSRGPRINVLTAGCGREGRQEHPSCLSVHNTWG